MVRSSTVGGRQFCSTNVISVAYTYFSSQLNCFLVHITVYQAARETGALQAAKNKLEKQVEELTWRLQLEKRMRVSFIQ
jgi:hypothetical protein